MILLYLRKIAPFIVPVMVLIIICFLANSNVNQHYHKLASGYVVKHAHPYKKENSGVPFQSHHHSSSEFFLLDSLSIALCTFVSIVLVFLLFPRIIKSVHYPIIEIYNPTDLYFLKNYHAPPVTL